MSMNLIFEVKGCNACVDFPYQTRTSLTYEVLRAESLERRLELLAADMADWEDREWAEQKYAEIKDLMESPNLELSLI